MVVYKLTYWYNVTIDIDNKSFIKYRINVAKVYKKYYTLDEELTRFEKALAIILFNKIKNLCKLFKEDEILMRLVRKTSGICR